MLDGCDDLTISTTDLPDYNEDDATEEDCVFVSYRNYDCNEDPGTFTLAREYYGYAPDKCGDQILRTETFGARKCGKVCWRDQNMTSVSYFGLVVHCVY